jgi:hypothetical protein
MRNIITAISILLLSSVTAYAQDVPVTGYDLDIRGTSSSTYSFLPSTVRCAIVDIPGNPGTVNPRYLVWDDTATTVCVHDTGANTGALFALPIGSYTAQLYATNGTGTDKIRSNPSNQVNFSRLAMPAARTGLRVRVAQ